MGRVCMPCTLLGLQQDIKRRRHGRASCIIILYCFPSVEYFFFAIDRLMFQGKRRRESVSHGKNVAVVSNGKSKVLQSVTRAEYDNEYTDNYSKAIKIPKTGANFGESTGDSNHRAGSSHLYSVQQGGGPTFRRNEKNQLIISLNSPDDSLLSNTVSSGSNPYDTLGGTPALQISTTSAGNETREDGSLQATRAETEESAFKKRSSTSKGVISLPESVSSLSASVNGGDHVSSDHSPNVPIKSSLDSQNTNAHSLVAKSVTKGVTTERASKVSGVGQKKINAIGGMARGETGLVHSTASNKLNDKIVSCGKDENSATLENSHESLLQSRKNSDGYDSSRESNVPRHVQPTEGRSTPEGNNTMPLVTGSNGGSDHQQPQFNPNAKKEGSCKKGGSTKDDETLKSRVEEICINGKELEKKGDVGEKVTTVASLLPSKVIVHKPGPLASSQNTFSVESPRPQEISVFMRSLGGHGINLTGTQDIDRTPNSALETVSKVRNEPDDLVKYKEGFSGRTAPVKTGLSLKKYPGNIALLQKIYKKPVNSLTKSDIRHVYLEMTEEQILRRSRRYQNAFRSLIRNRKRYSARNIEQPEQKNVANSAGNEVACESKDSNKIDREAATSLSTERNVDKLPEQLSSVTIQRIKSSADLSPSNTADSDTKNTPSSEEQHTALSSAEKSVLIDSSQNKNDEQSVFISKDADNPEVIHTRNIDIRQVSNPQSNTNISASNEDSPVVDAVNLDVGFNGVSDIHVRKPTDPEGEAEPTQVCRDGAIQENSERGRPVSDSNVTKCNSDSALESSNLDVAIISGKRLPNGSPIDLETGSGNVSRKAVVHYFGADINIRPHEAHSTNDDQSNFHDSILPNSHKKPLLTQAEQRSEVEKADTKFNFRSPSLEPDDRISQPSQNLQGGTSDMDSSLVHSDRSNSLHRVKKLTRKITELQEINLQLKKKLGKLSNEVVNYEVRLSSIVGMVSQMRKYKETMEEVCARMFTSPNSEKVGGRILKSKLPDSYVVSPTSPKSSGNKSTVESEFLSLEALIMKRVAEYKAFEISLMEKQEILGEISEISDISVLSESPFVRKLKEKLIQTSESFRKYRGSMVHRVENLKQELERTQKELASSKEELGRHSRAGTKLMTSFFQLRERSQKDRQIISEQKKRLEFLEQELKAKESMVSKNKAQEGVVSQVSSQNQQLIAQLKNMWTNYRALYNQCATQQSKIQAYEESLKYSHTQLAGLQEKLRLQNDEISRISNQRVVDYGPSGNLFWKSEYDKLLQMREKERSTFKAQISNIHKSYHKLLSDREKGYQAVIDSMNEIVGSDAAGTPSISAYPASSGGTHNSNTSNPVFSNTGTRNGRLLVEQTDSNGTTVSNVARQDQASEAVYASGSLAKQPHCPTSNTENESVTSTNKMSAQRLFVNPDDNIPEPIKLRYTIYVPENTDDLDSRISEISRNSATEVQDTGS